MKHGKGIGGNSLGSWFELELAADADWPPEFAVANDEEEPEEVDIYKAGDGDDFIIRLLLVALSDRGSEHELQFNTPKKT